jgi:mono/diheme cytochrome c family protein
MKMKSLLLLLTVLFAGAVTMSFITMQDQAKGAPWDVPEKYKKMENPHKGDKSLERIARAGWAKHCRSCHGNQGLGDGPRAANLKTFPGNFKDPAFQAQTDGEIYYQSFIGRDEMPNFEARIPDEEERWAIVNLIRTMK